jgi:hypothetical protein
MLLKVFSGLKYSSLRINLQLASGSVIPSSSISAISFLENLKEPGQEGIHNRV